jgi:hypothetical protein
MHVIRIAYLLISPQLNLQAAKEAACCESVLSECVRYATYHSIFELDNDLALRESSLCGKNMHFENSYFTKVKNVSASVFFVWCALHRLVKCVQELESCLASTRRERTQRELWKFLKREKTAPESGFSLHHFISG